MHETLSGKQQTIREQLFILSPKTEETRKELENKQWVISRGFNPKGSTFHVMYI